MASYLRCIESEAGGLIIGDMLVEWWEDKLSQLRETRKAGTTNKYAAVLRAVLRFAERTKKIPCVPIHAWGICRVNPRDTVISPADVLRLLQVVDREAPHLSAIVRYAAAVPSRSSELISMRTDHLDVANNRIRLPAAHNKGRIGVWKPIPPEMVDYFRGLPPDTEWLFYRRDHRGRAWPLGCFKRSWNRCLGLAGLAGRVRFHDLRHHSATNLVNNGTPERVVMQVAGWRTNMLRHYYHRTDDASLICWNTPNVAQNIAPVSCGGGV
jgi:integrase